MTFVRDTLALLLVGAPSLLAGDLVGPLFPGAQYAIPEANDMLVVEADVDQDGVADLVLARNQGGQDNATVLLGNGDGTFSAPLTSAAGPNLTDLAVGDVDQDGFPDLAVTHEFGNQVSVLLGAGDGTFGPAQSYGTSSTPTSVALADLDDDGDLDLAVANRFLDFVNVRYNAGDGSFPATRNFFAGNGGLALAIADLDLDGLLDIAVSRTSGVSVLLGTGAGLFGQPQVYGTGISDLRSLVIDDLDRDGAPDMVFVRGQSTTEVALLMGVGDGTFGPAQTVLTAGVFDDFSSVTVGDIDGDGVSDLAIATSASVAEITLLRGVGDGTFGAPEGVPTGHGPSTVAIADLDQDGTRDLAVATYWHALVLLGTGGGAFDSQQVIQVGSFSLPRSVAVAHLDPDGVPDVVVANEGGGDVSVLLGTGGGTVGAPQDFAAGSAPSAVAVADVNGDGAPDLAVSNANSNNVTVRYGAGDGTFPGAGTYPAGSAPASLAIGDLDQDGSSDLAVANEASDTVSVLLGDGDGAFLPAPSVGVGDAPVSVALADLDGDGDLDLAVANELSDDVSVMLGVGDGTFGAAQGLPAGSVPSSLAIGDLDEDGSADLVVTNLVSDDIAVFLGAGGGTFAAPLAFAAGDGPRDVAIGDLDQDGWLDLAVARYVIDQDSVSVLLGEGDGAFAPLLAFAAEREAVSLAIADLDADGLPDLVVANRAFPSTVSVLLNSRQGDPWVDLGGGAPGTLGIPSLVMSGPLTAKSLLSLDLTAAAPSAFALLFISFTSTPTPFLGGTLHAFPLDLLIGVATDASGEIHGSANFDGAPSDQDLWFQVGIVDPSVPIYGASLSNGVRGTVP